MPRGSLVVVVLYFGRPCLWNFYSTITVDVVWVMSEMSILFDPVCSQARLNTTWIFLNALYE